MITESILNLLCDLVYHVLSILPDSTFDVIPPAAELTVVIQAISPFMPVTAFTVFIGVFISIQVIKFGSSGINWILRKFFIG